MNKIVTLIAYQGKYRLAGLLLCVVGMALLETVGVASILPFMSLVADPSIVFENRWMSSAYDGLGFGSPEQFLFWTGIAVLAFIGISNAATAFTSWLLLRFTWQTNHDLSKRLLSRYLSEPYAFYLERNTASLNKTLLAEVAIVINGVLIPGMQLVARGVVAACLLTLLFIVNPVLSLVVAGTIGGSYALIYAFIRKRQAVMGRRRLAANGQRYQIAAEALGGIKEVKVLGRERFFLDRFDRPSLEFSNTSASNAIVSQLPRYALEAVAFGGVLLVILYFLRIGQDIDRVLPVISLYAFAGYRLMPALQQVFRSLTNIRFNLAAVDRLYEDLARPGSQAETLAEMNSEADRPMAFERDIRFEDVHFDYPGSNRPALHSLNLTIARNESIGLAGSTGSGKTTLVDLLLGLYQPSGGQLLVDGVNLTAERAKQWRRRVGYVPQHIFLCDDSIASNIAFGIPEAQVDRDAVERAARTAHLYDFVMGLPAGFDTVVGERGVRLSGGQRQRIGIARALYHEPDVLVMDEATSALDGITEKAVMQAINELAGTKTIILVAHRLSTVRSCDRIVLLESGRIAAEGSYEELNESSPTFRAMAGIADAEEVAGRR